MCAVRFFVFVLAVAALAGPGQSEEFRYPGLLETYRNGNDLMKGHLERTTVGGTISGTGTVAKVRECGFWDVHCTEGYRVLLDDGESQVILYYPLRSLGRLMRLDVGSRHTFRQCRIVELADWGFNQTVYCNMERF
ncbi:MAG: hypothetical protein GDA52_02630 [Rhodobacteraceae bacterium]|nr:hypothetical protein [Paracoccaceae bacterium]